MTMRNDIKFVAAGQIRREFIIDVNGRTVFNQQGGSLLYAAASIHHWGERVGLLGVVDEHYPSEWLENLSKNGLDTRGVKTASEAFDLRSFLAYTDARTCICENPVAVYAAHNLPFPKELLGYLHDPDESICAEFPLYSRILLEKIPDDYLEATAAHICPLDAACQIKLAAMLEKGAIRHISLQPHRSSMVPERIGEVAVLCKDATVIFVREMELRNLFRLRAHELWEMTSTLCAFGCRAAVVKLQHGGYLLHDAFSSLRYVIPDYPARVIDPTGENDVFCGAYLATYQATYDPLAAAVKGSAAASIKREGSGPFSIDTSLPGLDAARMENIRSRVVRG
ncbi:MAG TPA: carbohydrate kinase family protein [Anaerolineaceae bacterium]|nr:carbohydrate kinase family protein [Anaerolineaceae bacterium]